MTRYDQSMACRIPRGVAENFNRLEEMRQDIMFVLNIDTTNPYHDEGSVSRTDESIQLAADRLKKIWLRRANALKDARERGWQEISEA